MILTICPNPCIDCTIELEALNVGRLNRIENRIETLSGKTLNTAVGIARLGGDVFASGFMFDTGGHRFCRYLDGEGVKNRFVWNKGRVRVNYKIIDGKAMMTEINDRGDEVFEKQQEELIALSKELSKNASITIVSGSLPGGVDDSYYAKLFKSLDSKTKKIVDCEKNRLIEALSTGVYLVKPNLYELETATGETYSSFEEMLQGCYRLLDLGAEKVLLSLGKEGAIYTDGSKNFYCKSANVAVNSTVGAGDSMLAAFCLADEQGFSEQEKLRCAVAAGTASVTTPGTNLFYKDKYDEIYEKLKVQSL